MFKTRACPALWPVSILVAEILLFFRKILFQPASYIIPWDFEYYHYNAAEFLAASLREGHLPLWDPYSYCGVPFFANLQAQVFYPPALVTALAANWIGPQHLIYLMVLCLLAHILFAGLCTYWLLRTMDCSKLAGLIGATALQLGCYFVSQTQHLGGIEGSAWLPLGALAVVQLSRKVSARWTAVLAACMGASILAGYPSGVGSVLLGTAFLVTGLMISRRAGFKLGLLYLIAVVAGAAFAAIQVLPTLQVTSWSVSKYRGDWRGYGSGIRLEALASLVWPNYFHILDLRGYNLPYNFTFLYLYCGIAILVLAAIAFIGNRHSLTIAFGIFTLISALFMFGDATPIGRILTPYFHAATHDSIYPEFLMAGFSLGIAVLAALGADRLRRRPVLLGAILAFSILDLTYAGSGRPMNTRAYADEPGITPRHFDGSVSLLEGVRQCSEANQPAARIDTFAGSMGWVMMAPAIRIPTAGGNDPFALNTFMNVRRMFCGGTRWGRYYEVTDLGSPILDLLNVRCMVSRQPLPPNRKWHRAADLPGQVLSINPSVLPRFFLVTRTTAATNMEDGIAKMRSADFDPARVAIVEGLRERDYGGSSRGDVRVVHYAPQNVTVAVDAGAGSFLVTSEANYPGWQASIDGNPVPIVQTNVAFRGLDVPAGHHQIVFRFRPPVFCWGAVISALALAGLLSAGIRSY